MLTSEIRVHCRTGSLESSRHGMGEIAQVHCRTGSLEMEEDV